MIKQIIAFILLLACLLQISSRVLVYVDYYANTSAYAKNCVNKNRPAMHCNGKCQMMKKLQEEEKKEQENQEKRAESRLEIVLSTKSFFAILPPALVLIYKTQKLPALSNGKATDISFDIFHPPQA